MSGIYELDTSADLTANIIWQYNQAQNLIKLITNEQDFYNNAVADFWEDWQEKVFNLDTANYFGLIVWTKILDCTNYIDYQFTKPATTFGFGIYNKNFYNSNFVSNASDEPIPSELLRILLKVKIFNMMSNGSLYDINRMLANVFSEYNAYADYDVTTNTLTYHFDNQLPAQLYQLLSDSNVLLAPIGVQRAIINGRME